MNVLQIEKAGRAVLRKYGFQVESVPFIRRREHEFAALVVSVDHPEKAAQYRAVIASSPLKIAYEHVGTYDIRMYIEWK